MKVLDLFEVNCHFDEIVKKDIKELFLLEFKQDIYNSIKNNKIIYKRYQKLNTSDLLDLYVYNQNKNVFFSFLNKMFEDYFCKGFENFIEPLNTKNKFKYTTELLKRIKQVKTEDFDENDYIFIPDILLFFKGTELEPEYLRVPAKAVVNYLEKELKSLKDLINFRIIEEKEDKEEEVENINEIKIPNKEIEYITKNGKILIPSIYTQQDLYSIIYMSYYNSEILKYYKEYKSITGFDDGLKNYFIFISDYILFKKKDSEIEEKVEWKDSFNEQTKRFREKIELDEAIENFEREGKKNKELDKEISNFIEKKIGENHRLYNAKEALVNHIKEALIDQINKTKNIKIP